MNPIPSPALPLKGRGHDGRSLGKLALMGEEKWSEWERGSHTPRRTSKRNVRMCFSLTLLLGLWIVAFSQYAFGQTSLPWARPEQPKGPEVGEVTESQLPLVTARMEGSGEVWVGEAVPLNVEVIVPTWFTGGPPGSRILRFRMQ